MRDYMLWHTCALVNYSYLLKTGEGDGSAEQSPPKLSPFNIINDSFSQPYRLHSRFYAILSYINHSTQLCSRCARILGKGRSVRYSLIALALLLAACSNPGAATPTLAPTPPPSAQPQPRAVTITATDGVTLTGTLYGAGATAIILSNMGDNDPGPWDAFAPQLAGRGYIVLTYKYRYPTNSSSFDSGMANHTLDDLRAAIAFVRGQGAQKLVLVGASLGGMATAKAAAIEKPIAIVIMAAPVDLAAFNFRVEASELRAIAAPKLFIGSEGDSTVPLADTRQMFDLSPDPKQLQTYPGSAHGVRLFKTEHGDDLRQRLIAFITANAPPV